MNQPKLANELIIAREKRGLSRKQAAGFLHPLGYTGTSALEEYERGRAYPPLETALALEIIYRQPIAFLWPQLYSRLREQIRTKENALRSGADEETQPNA
jgi:transcriptional regulator with XRE-family HTH domain